MRPRAARTLPRIPVSSATSRIAVCSAVSPSSMWPLGSDHSIRPRRSMRPIRAATCESRGPSIPSMTRPPADVSCTVRSRSGPRRGERGRRGVFAAESPAGCASVWFSAEPAAPRPRRRPRRRRGLACSPSDTQAIVAGHGRVSRTYSPLEGCAIPRRARLVVRLCLIVVLLSGPFVPASSHDCA